MSEVKPAAGEVVATSIPSASLPRRVKGRSPLMTTQIAPILVKYSFEMDEEISAQIWAFYPDLSPI